MLMHSQPKETLKFRRSGCSLSLWIFVKYFFPKVAWVYLGRFVVHSKGESSCKMQKWPGLTEAKACKRFWRIIKRTLIYFCKMESCRKETKINQVYSLIFTFPAWWIYWHMSNMKNYYNRITINKVSFLMDFAALYASNPRDYFLFHYQFSSVQHAHLFLNLLT